MPLCIVNSWYTILLPEVEVTYLCTFYMYLLEVIIWNNVKTVNKCIPGNDSSFEEDNSAEF